MPEHETRGEVPAHLLDGLRGRDLHPFYDDMWIKYQYISRISSRATNFRFYLMKDGRLYFARNSGEATTAIFNTELPKDPTRILTAAELDNVKEKLDQVDFFNLPSYVETPARDGAIIIVSARRGEHIHEVWYVNVNDALTDYLFTLPHPPSAPLSDEERIKRLQELLSKQEKEYNELKKRIGE